MDRGDNGKFILSWIYRKIVLPSMDQVVVGSTPISNP